MVAEPIPFREQIPVVVCATDPLSRAGIVSQLRRTHGFSIAAIDDAPGDAVALFVADAMTDDVAGELRALRGRGIVRIVLLVARVDDRDLLAAVEAGVSGVVRRNEATAGNLATAIRSASAGEGTLSPDLLGRLLRQVGQLQRQVLAPRGLTFSTPARSRTVSPTPSGPSRTSSTTSRRASSSGTERTPSLTPSARA